MQEQLNSILKFQTATWRKNIEKEVDDIEINTHFELTRIDTVKEKHRNRLIQKTIRVRKQTYYSLSWINTL